MASFFISHSSRDEAASARVRDRLQGEGYQSVFLDFDPEQGIPAGRDWERELYAQLRRADAVVFLCTPASVESKWCFAELALARATGKPIFPIAFEPGVRHPLLDDTQSVEWIDVASDGDVALERLWAGLRSHGFDPRDAFAWDSNRPPFPGLSALEAEDAAVFFGRETEIEELLGRLQPILASARRLITVIGPSGSGKSSLVRAGLVPRLQRLSGRWTVVPPLKPGYRPLSTLARRLSAMAGESDWRRTRERIERDPRELVRVIEDMLGETVADEASVLLVVDQAEEIVTADPDERAGFLAAVGAALEETSPLWVVATLRSEYVTAVLQDSSIADVIGPAVVLGLLDRTRIPEVIAEPARRAGVELDTGLAARMVEETGGGHALPLLAYTLRQLYDRAGPERRITTSDYEAIGGVLGALRGRADAIVEELARSAKGSLVIPTLLKFASVEQESEPIGRRVLRVNLSTDENEVVQAFLEARLLTSDGTGHEAAVGIAHDSLLRSWAPLRQAIDASRESLRLRSELEHLAREWDVVGRPDSYLLREDRLAVASSFVESELGRDELPLIREFVQCSRAQSEAVLRRESELLGGRVLDSLDEDPERGLLLALAAVEEYVPSPRAIRALNAAVVASKMRVYLRGHEDWVMSAAFSPDGSRVLTGSQDRSARLWNAASGEQLARFDERYSSIRSVAFSPDGRRFVTAAVDGTVRIRDVASGEETGTVLGHDGPVWSVVFSPDGRWLVTASGDGTARVWDAGSGERLSYLWDHTDSMKSAAFSPDGSHVATASTDGAARIWDSVSGDLQLTLRGHEGAVTSVSFSPDAEWLVTASEDGTARIWQAASGRQLRVLSGHDDAVWSAAFSPDGRHVLTGSKDETARVWEAALGNQLRAVSGRDGDVLTAAFSPDGSRIVTGSYGVARLWDSAIGEELHVLCGHDDSVGSAAFAPDGTRVVTASEDRTVRIWSAATGEEECVIGGHQGLVRDAAFSPDGTRVVSGAEDGTARIWDAAGGAELVTLRGHTRGVWSVCFSPDGSRVLTGSYDGTARIWDVASGEDMQVLRGHDDAVWSAAFSPDGSRVVTGSFDRTARIWDVASGEEVHVLRGHDDAVWSVAFSPDGSLVVTASDDGTIRLWEAESGSELRIIGGDEGSIRGVAFSPDGGRIVGTSYSLDHPAALVWDVESGEELQVLRGHEGGVRSAVFSVDGTRVVTASDDGTARLWESLTVELLIAKARAQLARELTDSERVEYGLPHHSRT